MAKNGITRKLAIVAAALGAILLVLRVVGGRGGDGVDEDAIDRVDTGRSEDEGEGGPVETGLERVSTADDTADITGGPDTVGTSDATGPADTDDTADDLAVGTDVDTPGAGDDEDQEGENVPVLSTDGRFDDLDVFDVISIVSAGVDAAREEYRSRT